MKVFWIGLCGFLLFALQSCDSDDKVTLEESVAEVKAGDIHEAYLYIDDEVGEYVKDEFVNFGSEENPVLFPVVKEHSQFGLEVADRTSNRNTFRSVSKEEIVQLMHLYADANELPVTEQEDAFDAFAEMNRFLKTHNINMGLPVAIVKLNSNINPFTALQDFSKYSESDLNDKLKELEDALLICSANQIPVTKGEATAIIKAIAKGMDYALKGLKIVIKLIEGLKPKVDINSSFAAYLNENDLNPMHYPTAGHESFSKKYTLQHKFWGVTYAKVRFMVVVDYNGINNSLNDKIQYIPSIAFLVDEIKCVTGQHVKGSCTLGSTNPYIIQGETSGYNVLVVPGEINISYGDCCCYNYHASLKFEARGDKGFVETGFKKK